MGDGLNTGLDRSAARTYSGSFGRGGGPISGSGSATGFVGLGTSRSVDRSRGFEAEGAAALGGAGRVTGEVSGSGALGSFDAQGSAQGGATLAGRGRVGLTSAGLEASGNIAAGVGGSVAGAGRAALLGVRSVGRLTNFLLTMVRPVFSYLFCHNSILIH
jgi:hypothetical protein